MTPNEYQTAALRTMADQECILDRLETLGPGAMQLLNGAVGLSNDAGEVCKAVGRYVEYGHDLDHANLLEGVGGCLQRLAQVCDAAGFTLEQAMQANLRKLVVRCPDKYTEERANHRDLEAERAALGIHSWKEPDNPQTRCIKCGAYRQHRSGRMACSFEAGMEAMAEDAAGLSRDYTHGQWDDPDSQPGDRSGS